MRFHGVSSKLYPDLSRINFVHWCHFLCLMAALIIKLLPGNFRAINLLFLILIPLFYRGFFKALHYLYYSFWVFAAIDLIYIFYSFFTAMIFGYPDAVLYIYLSAFGLIILEMYVLYAPIYYPKVVWWEYDFRYRHELKIKVQIPGLNTVCEGRLTDLRRNAGCIVLFEKINLGENLTVRILSTEQQQEMLLSTEVMSVKEYTFGRGHTYGVKFLLQNKLDKKAFKNLCRLFKEERRSKNQLKVETQSGISDKN